VKHFKKSLLILSILTLFVMIGCQSQYMTAGKVYYGQSPPNYDAAIEQFKLAVQAEPQNPETYLWLGKAYAGKKQYEEACKQTEKHMQNKEYELAAKRSERSLDFDGKNTQSLNLLAYCFEKLEKNDEAEKTYRKALELVPGDMDAYINLSNFYFTREKTSESAKILKKSLKIIEDPNWLKAENVELAKKRKEEATKIYVDLGRILLKDGKAKESEAILAKAIELNPDDRDVNFSYGLALLNQDKFVDAIRVFKKVVAPGDTDAEGEYYLGFSYLKAEKYGEAIGAFTKSLEIDPDFCDSYINRAYAERELGNTSAAYQDAKMGLECQKRLEKK